MIEKLEGNRQLTAYEIKDIEDNGVAYKIILKDSVKENKDIRATISKIMPMAVNDSTSTALNVIGKVPAEKANNYNDSIHLFGLPSRAVIVQDSITPESSAVSFSVLESILNDCVNEFQPIKVGDLFIVEVQQ